MIPPHGSPAWEFFPWKTHPVFPSHADLANVVKSASPPHFPSTLGFHYLKHIVNSKILIESQKLLTKLLTELSKLYQFSLKIKILSNLETDPNFLQIKKNWRCNIYLTNVLPKTMRSWSSIKCRFYFYHFSSIAQHLCIFIYNIWILPFTCFCNFSSPY